MFVVAGAPAAARGADAAAVPTAAPATATTPPAIKPEHEEFFEKRVRPILVERCFKCHGSEKQEAGLRLDGRDALMHGGDEGPVVDLTHPDQSKLVKAIQYSGDIQMPPDAKLPPEQIEALSQWVTLNLPWPQDSKANISPAQLMEDRFRKARAEHWSFQPIGNRPPPQVKNEAWPRNPLDQFVLAKLEQGGMTPSPATDKATLARRATFDLIGLPPTAAEVDAFVQDASPDAYEKLLDRLLASPQYGERWARHWLDVARYADTKGYVFTEERKYPYSYTYRDYVIRAMNEDKPYNQFVKEQLAADQLALGDDNRPLAALGFLTLGRRFSNNQNDIIDDRIDVVSRGLLGLTVTCARCHDHKFDPIPQADYYSLYGVFASSTEPDDKPLLGKPENTEEYQKFQAELAKRQQAVDQFIDARKDAQAAKFREKVRDYLVAAANMKREGRFAGKQSFGPDDLRPALVRRWRDYLRRADVYPHVLAPWREFAALPADKFAGAAAPIMEKLAKNPPEAQINPLVRQALLQSPPTSMADVAKIYGDLLAGIDKRWREQQSASAAGAKPDKLPEPPAEELRQLLYADGTPTVFTRDEAGRLVDRADREALTGLKRKVEALKANSPAAPPRAMVLVDGALKKPHIFVRGNPARPGPEVPRQFVRILAGDDRKPFQKGSGRLELAEAIVAPGNPLTARVLVNRVWMHHFGEPLVRTPSDFGARSEPPSHPELLDYLAARFIGDGWSLKKLHRLMMTSQTYMQSSRERPEYAERDPENRLLSHMNRQRVDFEEFRDAMLAASGKLDRTQFGRPIDIMARPYSGRRTVYAFIDRQDLPGLFRVFDFASPDVSTPERPQTTVPQQALFALNSPFVLEQAEALAVRPEVNAAAAADAKVQALYRAVLSRTAQPDEVQRGVGYVTAETAAGVPADKAWQRFAQALLASNEFAFID